MASMNRGLQIYFNFYLRRRTPTLVYAMGRVGSVALFRSLYGHGEFALHAHILNPTNLKQKKGKRPGTSKWAYKQIVRNQRKVKIISLVRNPVECMMSAFAPEVRASADPITGYQHLSTRELSDQFRAGYFDRQRHLLKLNWFDDEFKAALGIDAYNYPFPKEAGYVRFQEGPCDVLIMRSELDDEMKSRVVSEFVGTTDLKIIRTRTGEKQPYGEIYKVFKERVAVPETYMDTIVNSRFAQHFFTPAMLSAMKERFISREQEVVINQ